MPLSSCGQLLRELAPIQHPNIVSLEDIFLSPQDHSLYMVFEYADYNLLVPLALSLLYMLCVAYRV
jgi:serine/threonine protein kinase